MKLELMQLKQVLEEQRDYSRDLIVDTSTISAYDAENDIFLTIPLPEETEGTYPLTDYAHGQLAEKCKIPKRFYEMLRNEDHIPLLKEAVNELMPQTEKRMIRILFGQIRAVLSDRYQILDNYGLLIAAMQEFRNHDITFHRCDLTETRMYIKVFENNVSLEVPSGDHTYSIIPGLILSNSEVGAGRIKVEPAFLNPYCKNVMIAGSTFKAVHIGERKESGEIYKQDTIEAINNTTYLQIRDTISAAFDQDMIDQAIIKIANGGKNAIESPSRTVNAMTAEYNISEEGKNDLFDYFADESKTQLGASQAIARLAQDFENADRQVELERAAYDIAVMPTAQFNRLLAKHAEEDTTT